MSNRVLKNKLAPAVYSRKILCSIALISSFSVSQISAAAATNLPQTGQSKCYATDGLSSDEIACENTGQDGELRKGVVWPVPRFVDNNDGSVTDKLTGLIWLKDASCSTLGTLGKGSDTFAQALLASAMLADSACGLSDGSSAGDWRLPNARELESLISRGFEDMALPDATGIGQWSEGDPFMGVEFGYWSNTTNQTSATAVYSARFDFGAITDANKGWNDRYIWPVRGPNSGSYPAKIPKTGQTTCFDPSGATTDTVECAGTGQDGELQKGGALVTPRFTDNGDGTVTDNQTGLVWLQQSGCFGTDTWAQALAVANSLSDTGTEVTDDDCGLSDHSVAGSWRLPNVKELYSLVNYAYAGRTSQPAISNTAGDAGFVNYSDDPFTYVFEYSWSSTSNIDTGATAAKRMYFRLGEDSSDLKSGNYGVWPVRGPDSGGNDLMQLILPALISGVQNGQ